MPLMKPNKRIFKVYGVIVDNKKILMVKAPNGVTMLPGTDVSGDDTTEQALQKYMRAKLGIDFSRTLKIGQYEQDVFEDTVMSTYLLLINEYSGKITPKVEIVWADKKMLESGKLKTPMIFNNQILPDLFRKNII